MNRAPSRLQRRLRSGGDDTGAASVLVVGLIVVLMVVAGLVVDGGRAVNARATITDDAEQAARAGANQVDKALLRDGGGVRIDPDAARPAAVDYLVGLGYPAADVTATADDERVTVTVERDVPTALLSLIMINSFHVSGSATARVAVGVTDEIAPPEAP